MRQHSDCATPGTGMPIPYKWLCKVIIVIVVVLAMGGCAPQATWHRYTGSVWNTLYNIDYRADRPLDDSIQAALREVELSVSAFNPSSTVSRINRSSDPEVVDSMFIEVFVASQRINSLSGGLFDPTVAPLINLWGFGYEGAAESEPDAEAIADSLLSVGIGQCCLKNDTIYKKSPSTRFNFSAIAKGYGCDRVAAMLVRNGCKDYKVEIGGEIALGGKNSRGGDWRIMIDAPVPCDSAIHHEALEIISLTDCGIATSGSYRNYRDTPHGRRSHTINPATGYPVEADSSAARQISATVIAPTAMEADGLATACMAMHPDSAMLMIGRTAGVEALLVIPAADGEWRILRSRGFPAEQGQKK